MNLSLPTNPRNFSALVRSLRTETLRDEFWQRINAEFKQRDSIDRPGQRPPRAARTPSGRLFERRLLEFVRRPVLIRSINELDASQASAWMDLVHLRSRPFAAMLRRWMRAREPWLFREAARHLAWMGLDADAPRVIAAIRRRASDKAAWSQREQIASGLVSAAEDDRLGPRLRRTAFDAIHRVFTGPESTVSTNAAAEAFGSLAEALLALDRPRARTILSSPGVLRPDTAAAAAIMLQLHSDRDDEPSARTRPVDPAVLWPVYEALRDGRLRLARGDDPAHWARITMGNILAFTADGDPLRTMRECRAVLAGKKDKWDPLQIGAKSALKRCRRIPEPDVLLHRYWKATLGPGGKERPSPFGPAATHVIEAYALLDYHRGDGLHAYFDSMSAHWRRALAGLELIGAHAAVKLVRQAAGIAFGPVKSRPTPREAAGTIDNAASRRIQLLSKPFSAQEDAIQSAVERYIARHAADFRG